ncbi:NADP-dependent malic enzyme-like isoform X1 [Galleria mellonella]|uniref:Malic enzyme n=1 Tax=Galleria mellonella TaxID=7137 RepID=A0A6J1X275_GALME|nr:NADP-dependent malic enzyme-like isoform X1 [Galleria mellonella]XP_052750085.1 NADP-dependent malic enzyme-like isoform X1 [Galleria mellonella]
MQQCRNFHEVTGNVIVPNMVRGIDHLKDPRLNKGLAFTLEERQALGLQGLLATNFKTQEQQIDIARISVDRYKSDLNKYLYLVELQDTNERLFFSLLDQNIEKYLPIVYTPTVGLACQRFGLIYRRARGLFISINDKGYVYNIIRNWPEHDVRAIVFTDGERILGLGDLGAYGMGIPVGKLSLYTALAGIKPHQCLPILLDVGTDNETLLEDPLYIGLRHKRVRGEKYDEFVDEFMKACITRFGPNTLLQFEDFALPNAGRFLKKYQEKYCTFNDDIQGTASVVVAGLMAATRITKKKLSENIYLYLGAGSAANGIANLTVLAMMDEGLSEKDARDRIFMFDVDGLLSTRRSQGVPKHAENFGKDMEPETDFERCVEIVKPTCLIGCSTIGGAFTPSILKLMGKHNQRPIIFALSNPTNKAECTAQAAYDNTEGRCVFSSGSPFPPVSYDGKEYHTGQGNNSYIFPGVALGVIATSAHHIPDYIFLTAAKTLAEFVHESDLKIGRLYPPLKQIKEVSLSIASEVAEMAYKKDLATVYPKPKDMQLYLKSHLYQLKYPDYLPKFYKYPDMPNIKVKSFDEAYSGIMLDEYGHTPSLGETQVMDDFVI